MGTTIGMTTDAIPPFSTSLPPPHSDLGIAYSSLHLSAWMTDTLTGYVRYNQGSALAVREKNELVHVRVQWPKNRTR